MPFYVVLEERDAVGGIQAAAVLENLLYTLDREALVFGGGYDHQGLRGAHCQQFVIVGVADQLWDEVAMLSGTVPVERPSHRNLLIEITGSHNGHGNTDVIIQCRRDPCVVAVPSCYRDAVTAG